MKFDKRLSEIEDWRSKNMTVAELFEVLDVFLLALAMHSTAEQYERVREVAEREVVKVLPSMGEACRERWPYRAKESILEH